MDFGRLFRAKNENPLLNHKAWTLMVVATDPDRCWNLSSLFRKTDIPGNVLTCETAFLMGSIVRDVIRSVIPDARQRQALSSAEKAYFKTFDDQSEEELPPQMAAFYGNESLGHVARAALTGYGEQGDVIFLTVPIFIRRIEGDPRMSYEITPLLEEQKLALSKVFSKAIK